MYSEHSQRIGDTREPAISFEAALAAEDAGHLSPWRRQGSVVRGQGLRQTVSFTAQLSTYLAVFGRPHVHVVIYDDLQRDTDGVYRGVLQSLGVPWHAPTALTIVNANRRVRNLRLQKFLLHPPRLARRFTRATLPQPVRRFIGNGLLRVNSPHEPRPPMDPALRRRLQQQLRPDVEALSALLDRDLTHWVRDGADRP
jgi:hypothetical protein